MVSGVKRSGVLIGLGLVVGLGLVLYGAHRLTAPKTRPAARVAVAERIRAVTAIRPIARGSRIEAADISVADLPGAAPAGALTAAGSAIGRVAAVDIPVRQVIVDSALASTASLAAQVPVGYRAISIQTNDEIAVSDLLRPGDIVDVELVLGDAILSKGASGVAADRSESNTLLQAVRVVSVGDLIVPSSADGAKPPTADRAPPRRTMTLAMTPEQVAQFILARNLGNFYLALRNPADRQGAARAIARLPDIRAAGAPAVHAPAVANRAARPTRPAAPAGVELVVGGDRQVIYPE